MQNIDLDWHRIEISTSLVLAELQGMCAPMEAEYCIVGVNISLFQHSMPPRLVIQMLTLKKEGAACSIIHPDRH